MDRWTILDGLRVNWPSRFPQDRIALIEKRLRRFSKEAVSRAVDEVLDTAEYPPTASLLVRAAASHQARLDGGSSKVQPKPGDTDPRTGERYMTGEEARAAFLKLVEEYPDLPEFMGRFERTRVPRGRVVETNKTPTEKVVASLVARAYLSCMAREGVKLGDGKEVQKAML